MWRVLSMFSDSTLSNWLRLMYVRKKRKTMRWNQIQSFLIDKTLFAQKRFVQFIEICAVENQQKSLQGWWLWIIFRNNESFTTYHHLMSSRATLLNRVSVGDGLSPRDWRYKQFAMNKIWNNFMILLYYNGEQNI